jgi:hypothetical protein
VVENGTCSEERILKHLVNSDHPVCAAKEWDLFINGAATLLFQEGWRQSDIRSQLLSCRGAL